MWTLNRQIRSLGLSVDLAGLSLLANAGSGIAEEAEVPRHQGYAYHLLAVWLRMSVLAFGSVAISLLGAGGYRG